MRCLALFLLLGVSGQEMFLSASDRWGFFHPELVTSMSCRVEQVSFAKYGESGVRLSWIAEAMAERKDNAGTWQMTIAEFPPTLKGRHQAEKECSKWMDEASKRVKAAR